jgi:hypothetical protein
MARVSVVFCLSIPEHSAQINRRIYVSLPAGDAGLSVYPSPVSAVGSDFLLRPVTLQPTPRGPAALGVQSAVTTSAGMARMCDSCWNSPAGEWRTSSWRLTGFPRSIPSFDGRDLVHSARTRSNVTAPGRSLGDGSSGARYLRIYSCRHAFPVPVRQRRAARCSGCDDAALAGQE